MNRRACPWLWLAFFVVDLPAVPARADDPPPDPAEARVRALLAIPLQFDRYVFDGAPLPRCAPAEPSKFAELFDLDTIRVAAYDRRLELVDAAREAGPYAAVVEAVPRRGRPMVRRVTLYRTATPFAPDWRFDPARPGELADILGIGAAAVERQSGQIAATLKDRPAAEFVKDARVARLFAGLALAGDATGPVHKYDDAFALERQWWVELKRRLAGLDRVYPGPFVGPRPIGGEPARTLRPGTEAEAGMKPGTADAIDAACRAFEADTDEAFVVCVARHGVIVIHKAYGQRDGRPMTVDTGSWMASITKAMSASLMDQLIDRGLVDLDDRVDRFLPELRGIEVETPLTIRHLYTHTNGLDKWPGWNDEMPDVADRVADYYPVLRVGKWWGYNGVGYELGGKVIEAVTDEAVPQFFHKHLLAPLGDEHTDVVGTHADAISTALDVARFGQLLLNRGAYGPWRFFRPETMERMLPEPLTKTLGPGTTKTFGIGLDGNRERIGHGAASAATFSVDLADDLIVVMARNKQGKNQDKYNGPIWDAIRNGIARDADGAGPSR